MREYHPPKSVDAAHHLQQMMRRNELFDLKWTKDDSHEMASTFAHALHGNFNPAAKLDASQVRDLRGDYLNHPKLFRAMLAHGRNPTDITDRRIGRPAPKVDLRLGAAGRHNSEDRDHVNPLRVALESMVSSTPKQKLGGLRQSGAFDGDGRLERPAPHGPDVQYVGKGDAGSRHTRRVIAKKPGEKLASTRPKPKKSSTQRFNQGRHDA